MFKKNKKWQFACFSALFLLAAGGCEKEFSVNAEGVEPFPIIYALLNPSDNEHYVKVYKSFLVENNAYDVVGDLDKYSYIDSIDVYLVEYNSTKDSVRTIRFYMTTDVPKDSGLFAYPTQVVYKADAELNVNFTYRLFVYNPYTKNIAYNEKPIGLAGEPTIRESVTKNTIAIPENTMTMKFFTDVNTSKYLLRLLFHYSEDLLDNTSRQPAPIVWTLGTVEDNMMLAGKEKSFSVGSGSDFFRRISAEVRYDQNVYRRRTDSIVYEIYAAAKDWDLYVLSTMPPVGVNQNRLFYSNLKSYNTETGIETPVLGFVSSRNLFKKQYRDLATPGSRDSLIRGRYTKDLLFTDKY